MSTSIRLSPRTARGFSLFELVLVTAIAGIIASIAMPRFAGAIARTRLQRAVHRLTQDIDMARQSARAASASKTLVFDSSTASYQLTGVFARDLSAEPFSVRMPTATFEGNQYVTFDGYGMPTTTGLISIRSGKFVQVITVSAGSDDVSVGLVTIDNSPMPVPVPPSAPIIIESDPLIKPGGFVLVLPSIETEDEEPQQQQLEALSFP